MTRGAHNLTDRQARQLVDHFMHYLNLDERRRLMIELPDAYNAYCGRPVLIVKLADTDRLP